MQVSAEARLWWRSRERDDVETWFEKLSDLPPGGAPSLNRPSDTAENPKREDVYVRDPGQAELGVKLRSAGTANERLEVKSLVAFRGDAAPFGPVTIWVKLSSRALSLDRAMTIKVHKQRRLRKYGWDGAVLREIALKVDESPRNGDLPEAGCNVEFTRATVEGSDEVWWTLGYEAFGGLDEVERVLRGCLLVTVARTPAPAINAGEPGSYPEWLMRVSKS
jgi:hypothetical protein